MTNDGHSRAADTTESADRQAKPDGGPLEDSKQSGVDSAAGQADLNEPDVPVGNSPPLPRWPLVLSALAWVGWLTFLVLMAVERTASAMV